MKRSSRESVAPNLSAVGLRFGVVASCFNEEVVDRLLDGALRCLLAHGADAGDVVVVRVPGAWEIPLALETLAQRGDLQGLVALGAVIRGETPHFDYICGECSRGAAEVALRRRLPVGFGLLTCNDLQQARERSGGAAGNKGWEAAQAALAMVHTLRGVSRPR